jgi:hypothetical protein
MPIDRSQALPAFGQHDFCVMRTGDTSRTQLSECSFNVRNVVIADRKYKQVMALDAKLRQCA